MSEWIEWNGGKCPVDPRITVETKDRDGYLETVRAHLTWWEHDIDQPENDIVAYRIAT